MSLHRLISAADAVGEQFASLIVARMPEKGGAEAIENSVRALRDGCRLCVILSGDKGKNAMYLERGLPAVMTVCSEVGLVLMGMITCRFASDSILFVPGSYPYPRNGVFASKPAYVLVYKKQADGKTAVDGDKESSKMNISDWRAYYNPIWENVEDEFEIRRRLILMFTFRGETVFDPFENGSTAYAAAQCGRESVGIADGEYGQIAELIYSARNLFCDLSVEISETLK